MTGKFLPGVAVMDEHLAKGLLNLVMYVEARAKMAFQRVGGPLPRPHSAPGEAPVVQTGNLRRSVHSVVVWDGGTLGGKPDENGKPQPVYDPPAKGQIVGYVGTNAGYGLFLEAGTARMGPRPFLTPAAADGLSKADAIIEAGAKK